MAKAPSKTGAKRGRPPKNRPQEELPLELTSQEEVFARKTHQHSSSHQRKSLSSRSKKFSQYLVRRLRRLFSKNDVKPEELPKMWRRKISHLFLKKEMANALHHYAQTKGSMSSMKCLRDLGN